MKTYRIRFEERTEYEVTVTSRQMMTEENWFVLLDQLRPDWFQSGVVAVHERNLLEMERL